MKKKHIALFFGSFNPIHIGHLIVADTVVALPNINHLWFVISPQNPFKQKKDLLNQYERLELVHLAIEGQDQFNASSIEFKLPQPSYTIDTLSYLHEKYPDYDFSIIMGEDNLLHFHKWKNYEQILEHYYLIVYPRLGYTVDKYQDHPKITRLEVPYIDISASYIRKAIKEGRPYKYMLHSAVYEYIDKMNLWK